MIFGGTRPRSWRRVTYYITLHCHPLTLQGVNWLTFFTFFSRIYATYKYFASAHEKLKDPSNQKLHEHVNRAVKDYKDCMKNYPARVCVYNRTISDQHPVSFQSLGFLIYLSVFLFVCLSVYFYANVEERRKRYQRMYKELSC